MLGRRFPRLPSLLQKQVRLLSKTSLSAADIEARLTHARRVYDHVELFVAPSRALKKDVERLGLPKHKIQVSDYGFVPITRHPKRKRKRLQIGFVGTLVWHKGAHILLEAVRLLPPDSAEVRLFGHTETFPDYVARLRTQAVGLPVRFEGGFDHEKVSEILKAIDLLVVPSLWPENSPLVIHEAFMAGVVVVGARNGGIRELVTHRKSGLLYAADSPRALARSLNEIVRHPELLTKFRRALPKVKTIAEEAHQWNLRYEALFRSQGEAAP